MDWYNSSWSCRKLVTITGSTAGAQTDFQVKVDVAYDPNMRSDFGDIRFTDSDGITLLDYWLMTAEASTSATFFVKVPSIPASPSTAAIYLYYGNPSATSTSSGEATFIYFDDFDDGIWNDRYDNTGDSLTESNGYLHMDDIGHDYGSVTTKPGVFSLTGQPVIVEWKHRQSGYGNFIEIYHTSPEVFHDNRLRINADCKYPGLTNQGHYVLSSGTNFCSKSSYSNSYVFDTWKWYKTIINSAEVNCYRSTNYGDWDEAPVSITLDASFSDYNYDQFYFSFGKNNDYYLDVDTVIFRKYATSEPVSSVEASYQRIWCVDAASPEGGDGSLFLPFKTINSAEAAASSGDEIRVKQGTYNLYQGGLGPLTITLTSGVYLRGGYDDSWDQTGGSSTTIVSGEGNVQCILGEVLTTATTIENFTITNGRVTGNGGGIYLPSGSSLWLDRVIVMNCTAEGTSPNGSGGAIYSNGANVNVSDSTFSGNRAGWRGGVAYGGAWTVTFRTFSGICYVH